MRGVVIILLVFSANVACADEIKTIVSLTQTRFIARGAVEFSLYFHNTGDRRVTIALPETVQCVLINQQGSKNIKAVLVSSLPEDQYKLDPKQFLETRYRFNIPDNLDGAVQMHLVDYKTSPVLFTLSEKGATEMAASAAAASDDADKDPSLDELFTLYQPYVANISAYDPMYFLVGTNPEKSRFQISFKYLFFDAQSRLGQKHPWLQRVYFGYTQTSFWDLESDSAPFEDTSYKPELLYLSNNLRKRPAWMEGFFIQTGARHESNGRGGDASRSTNTLYLKPIFILYDQQSRLGLQVSPKVMAYIKNDDSNNRDLRDYRGYLDLELKLGKADGLVLGSSFGFAPQGASIQMDLTCPLHRLWPSAAGICLQAQYVDALAESLLDYKKRTHAFRLGFAIVR
jgi:outer membrane phospholipase A